MKKLLILSMITIVSVSCAPDQKIINEKDAEIADLKEQLRNLKTFSFNGEEASFQPSDAELESYKSTDPPTAFAAARIPVSAARARIEIYKFLEGLKDRNYKPKKDIYGFTFTLAALDGYRAEIKAYNDTAKVKIDGIRVYYGRQLTVPLAVKKGIFLIPTQNNKNLYNIDDDFPKFDGDITEDVVSNAKLQGGSDILLNASVPCPHDC